MSEKLCKNCDNWKRCETSALYVDAERYGYRIPMHAGTMGICKRTIDSISKGSEVSGMVYNKTGFVYYNEDFGCIHFAPKLKTTSCQKELVQLVKECVDVIVLCDGVHDAEQHEYRVRDKTFLPRLVDLIKQLK